MKKFKKLTAAVAATIMAATLVAPMAMNFSASAATNVEITVPADSGIELTSVKAVKLFNITKDGSGNYSTTDTWETTGIISQTAIQNAMKTATDAADAPIYASPMAALTAISSLDGTQAEKLAKALANAGLTGSEVTPAGEATSANSLSFEGLGDGYYIITAAAKGTGDNETTVSLGMLTVVDGKVDDSNEAKIAKVGLPSVEKKVLEDVDDHDEGFVDGTPTHETAAGWNDEADYQIGEEIQFGLYGTLPENYDKYVKYYYEFEDTLGKEFARPAEDSFEVSELNGGTTFVKDEDYTLSITGDATSGYAINIVFADLKTNENVDADTVIVVKYKTSLTDAAIVANDGGQKNAVKLRYSNNPNQDGTGTPDKGETPEDKVIVFTYDLTVDKQFFNGTTNLTQEEIKSGAYSDYTFTLKDRKGNDVKVRKVTSEDSEALQAYDYVVDTAGTVTAMNLSLYDSTGNRVDTPVTDKDYALKIKIKGLDSDEYKIKETQPNGSEYSNTTADEDGFDAATIISNITYPNDWSDENLTLTYSPNSEGDTEVNIKNESGIKLPSTGGIGTTLFYLGGGAMVAVAGVFLITKKRMSKSEG